MSGGPPFVANNLTWTVLTGTTGTPGAIARWLNKSTLTAGTNGDADFILQESMGFIFSRLRHWQMLTAPNSATMAVGSSSDQINVPADMLEMDFMMIVGNVGGTFYQQELTQKQPNDIYRSWGYDGSGVRLPQMPMIYSFNQTFIQLDSQPDLAYPYIYTYYKLPSMLSSTNLTNFLTIRYPRLVRCAVMMMGAEWTKENVQGQFDRTYWEQAVQAELMEAQAQSDRARRASVNAPTYPGSTPGYIGFSGTGYDW